MNTMTTRWFCGRLLTMLQGVILILILVPYPPQAGGAVSRSVTIIIYLSDCKEGGATFFPRAAGASIYMLLYACTHLLDDERWRLPSCLGRSQAH